MLYIVRNKYMISGKLKSKKNPRISINKLAEYLEANSARRKKIVHDAKYPENYIVTRYKDARDTIKKYIIGGGDEDIILEKLDQLTEIKPDTDFQEQDLKLSIEALELFLDFDISALVGCEIHEYDENKFIKVSGVEISVNPDLIVKKKIGKIVNVGSIKIHISKSNPLNSNSQKIVGVMLHNYINDYVLKKGEVANEKLNLSFDIFQNTFEYCPSAIKVRLRQIEAACEEINLWWEKL